MRENIPRSGAESSWRSYRFTRCFRGLEDDVVVISSRAYGRTDRFATAFVFVQIRYDKPSLLGTIHSE